MDDPTPRTPRGWRSCINGTYPTLQPAEAPEAKAAPEPPPDPPPSGEIQRIILRNMPDDPGGRFGK